MTGVWLPPLAPLPCSLVCGVNVAVGNKIVLELGVVETDEVWLPGVVDVDELGDGCGGCVWSGMLWTLGAGPKPIWLWPCGVDG